MIRFIFLISLTTSSLAIYNIGLCITATNKYINFLPDLIYSSRKFFFPDHKITYYIFTDMVLDLDIVDKEDIVVCYSEHRVWPYSTLMRFKNYFDNFDILNKNDYLFAIDADMYFCDFVGDEILSDFVGTLHPGYYGKSMESVSVNFEKKIESKAFIDKSDKYFAGGFYGGSTLGFFEILKKCLDIIYQDLSKGHIPVWHDESCLNRFFYERGDLVHVLTPDYCFPENHADNDYRLIRDMKPKIIAVCKKNHDEIRK